MNKPTKDLGTYFLRVELENGQGWIETIHTGWRYTHGDSEITKLDADPISPTYESEDDLIHCTLYQYLQGNFSCDCNKKLFLARAAQEPMGDHPCGNTLPIQKMTLIRPNRTEVVIFAEGEEIELPQIS
jgi:hypothetical protein